MALATEICFAQSVAWQAQGEGAGKVGFVPGLFSWLIGSCHFAVCSLELFPGPGHAHRGAAGLMSLYEDTNPFMKIPSRGLM